MPENDVNANVPIVFVPGGDGVTPSGAVRRRIEKAIRDRLLVPSMEPYHKVLVAVERFREDARSLLAFLLRAYTYTTDIARIELDAEYRVTSVRSLRGRAVNEVRIARPDVPASTTRAARKVDMVFGTPVPKIPTAKAAVEYASRLAARLGYRVVKLLGESATVANYTKYLGGNLKAFGSVGHGFTGGIMLADGLLTSTFFDGLASKPHSLVVLYFNSCQTFNPPLQPAIMGAGARTFIGGKVDLLIGPSEEVFKCFWTRVLKEKKAMGTWLRKCEKAHYPVLHAHGLSGDSGKF